MLTMKFINDNEDYTKSIRKSKPVINQTKIADLL